MSSWTEYPLSHLGDCIIRTSRYVFRLMKTFSLENPLILKALYIPWSNRQMMNNLCVPTLKLLVPILATLAFVLRSKTLPTHSPKDEAITFTVRILSCVVRMSLLTNLP
jgi:hypothetical protein